MWQHLLRMLASTLVLAVWMALRVQGLTSSMPCGRRRRPESAVAAKKRKGRLVNELASSKQPKKPPPALVPVPGISAPKDNAIKGWVLGPPESPVRLAAVQSEGQLYVMDATCSRCSWELDKGHIHNKDSLCCPLCGQTYSLATGKPGVVVERAGFNKWLGDLARRAPTSRPAKTARTVRAALDGAAVLLDIEGSFLAAEFAAVASRSPS